MVIQWKAGDKPDGSADEITAWPTVQFVSGYANSLAPNVKVPAANIQVNMDYIGGGFGSKFGPDDWAVVGANLSKKAGGRPVKLFLDRATEQRIAGNRPSAFAKIKIGGKSDGTITAWQSNGWGTGGFGTVGGPPLPYVIDKIPNQRINHTAISVNAGPQRAWRAPNNQQASYLTCSAIEDFAAKAGLDPFDVFYKNFEYAPEARVETYRYQLQKAAEIAEWKKLWKPRGQATGTVKRGLGIGYQRVGRRGARQPVPRGDQPGRVGGGGDRNAGSGHRHPHDHHSRWRRKRWGCPCAAVKLNIGTNESAAGRRFGRFHHRGRRFVIDAQSDAERARQAVRSGGAGAGRAARPTGSGGRHHPRQGQSRTRALRGRPPAARWARARSPKWARTTSARRPAKG